MQYIKSRCCTWWVVESAKVRLELASKYFEGSRLADTVGAYETEHLSRARDREPAVHSVSSNPRQLQAEAGGRRHEPVQLESIGSVAMSCFAVEVGRKVDNVNCLERALLHADTTTDAKLLGQRRSLGIRSNLPSCKGQRAAQWR